AGALSVATVLGSLAMFTAIRRAHNKSPARLDGSFERRQATLIHTLSLSEQINIPRMCFVPFELRMSALGQKRTFHGNRSMSALPLKADIGSTDRSKAAPAWPGVQR